MIAAVLWKEYREARAVWLALVAVAALLLLWVPTVRATVAEPPEELRAILLAWATVPAWVYGMVCGAMLTAGERESDTQPFLDALPVERRRLWQAKALAGGLFVLAYGLVVPWFCLLGQRELSAEAVLFFVVPLTGGMVGYGWGMLVGTFTRTVLAGIVLAIVAQIVAFPVVQLILMVGCTFVGWLFGPWQAQTAVLLGVAICFLAPLLLSGWVYSEMDGRRVAAQGGAGPGYPLRLAAVWRRFRAGLWLTSRQSGRLLAAVLLIAAVAGLLVLSGGVVYWVSVTLLLGAVCGATAFADEQGGAYRWLGDGRLPLLSVWFAKMLLHGGVCLLAVIGMLAVGWIWAALVLGTGEPVYAFVLQHLGRWLDLPQIGVTIPAGMVVFVPAIHGFALGQLCGALCRKSVVAVVLAFGLGIPLLAVWVPSAMMGGLHGWQVLAAPLLVLIGTGSVLRPWVSDRLASATVVRRLLGTAVAVVAAIALGLWVRVAEVPDIPAPAGLDALLASLPADDGDAQAVRYTLTGLANRLAEHHHAGAPAAAPDDQFFAQMDRVLREGWPGGDRAADLAAALNRIFGHEARNDLFAAAAGPVVVLEDPRVQSSDRTPASSEQARLVCQALAVRGLQRQAEGDPAEFVRTLAAGLWLVRSQTQHAPGRALQAALFTEAQLLDAVERWLERLDDRPDLLRQLAALLARHQQQAPFDTSDLPAIDYLLLRHHWEHPQRGFAGRGGPAFWDAAPLLAVCEVVPWERARLDRLVRAVFAGWHDPRVLPLGLVALVPMPRYDARALERSKVRRLTLLEARRLLVALRWFAAARRRPANDLGQLVPDYLAAVPADPYDGQPFRYRLSRGEEIDWRPDEEIEGAAGMAGGAPGSGPPGMLGMPEMGGPAMPPVRMPEAGQPLPVLPAPPPAVEWKKQVLSGQGVLWSVGDDQQDNGGTRQGLTEPYQPAPDGTDLIFLVPLPPRRK